MEEKKLTDDEIVKDIERSTGMPSYWKTIVLDLIHRLQSEKKELKSIAEYQQGSNMERWRIIQEKDKTIAEQKAEIERLTKREKLLENAWNTSLETTKTVEIGRKASEARNAELQKQVDELLNRRIEPKIFHCHADALEPCPKVEKSVKDAAKEIFKEIFESVVFSFKGNDDYKKGFCDALEQYDKQLRDLAKIKGVEVEE